MREGAHALTGPHDCPLLRVLREGYITRDGESIVDASSSVVLVESAGLRVIVDTGSREGRGGLIEALESHGVGCSEVDMVVNTHLHADHCGCNDLFPGARFYAHRLESPETHFMRPEDGTVLAPGVKVMETPGHTLGSISVLVEADRRHAVAGDALPTKANYESHIPPGINVDRRLALASIDRLVSWAEIIVPGHDSPFKTFGKK
ncbi:MAG: MBL fold metallo-hydrolase [Thermoplasmata archaeon]|nr:MBL fold metallo-hydrolase [Thermoplasmata archaeon]